MNDIKSGKQKLFILIGLPGSGKTKLAKLMMSELGDNVVHVDMNNVRNDVCDKTYTYRKNHVANKIYIRDIATGLRLGYDVIADSTNLTADRRDIYFAICEALNKVYKIDVDIVGVFVSSTLQNCLEKCLEDGSIVDDNVLKVLHSKIEEPDYCEGFDAILNKY